MSKNDYKIRNRKIYTLRKEGASLKYLSKEFRVTKARILQILKEEAAFNELICTDSNDIRSLGMSHKCEMLLLRAGITTVDDLINESKDSLLSLRGFGVVCFNEVESALKKRGLTFVVDGF